MALVRTGGLGHAREHRSGGGCRRRHGAAHEIPTGDAWPLDLIERRRDEIDAAGLVWSVVESVPLHNDIKTRSGEVERYIDNYRTSIENIGRAGIPTVCYNFMPVVDWTRTSLDYLLPNQSRALRFEMTDFAAYDIFVLERANASDDYPADVVAGARQRFASLTEAECASLEKNIIAGLPGGEGSYTRERIRTVIAQFIAIGVERYRENLFAFLRDVVPVAERSGVTHVHSPGRSAVLAVRPAEGRLDRRRCAGAARCGAEPGERPDVVRGFFRCPR